MPRTPNPLLWVVDQLCDNSSKLWTKIARLGRETVAWLQLVHKRHPWIWFLIKTVGAIMAFVSVPIGIYYSRRGLQVDEQGSTNDRAIGIKQICVSGNLSEEDSDWCNKWSETHSMLTLFGPASSTALAIKHWLDLRLAALGLCGISSFGDRNSDTCIGLTTALAIFFLTRSIDKPFRTALLRDQLSSLITLATGLGVAAYLNSTSIVIGTTSIFGGLVAVQRLPDKDRSGWLELVLCSAAAYTSSVVILWWFEWYSGTLGPAIGLYVSMCPAAFFWLVAQQEKQSL